MEPADLTQANQLATWQGRVAQIVGLFKLQIGFAIAWTALAGYFAVAHTDHDPRRAAGLFLSVLVASAAAGAFNQYVERDLDARMERTRWRPFATGEFRPGWQWPALFAVLLVAALVLATLTANWLTALCIFLGAFTYGVVYTVWLKKRTHWNIVVGGLAGSFAVLAGAAAATSYLRPLPWVLALVLFLWTPSHFWSLAIALRRDYAGAHVPMLPVVRGNTITARVVLINTVFLVAATILPAFYGMGVIYVGAAVIGGIHFLVRSVRLVRDPSPEAGVANFRASLMQLALLLTGIIVSGSVGS